MTSTAPKSIGVILDGNRRWARARGLPTLEGHRRGFIRAKEIASWAHAAGVEEVIFYAFSTENWNRSEEEVSYLMELFERAFSEWMEDVIKNGGRIRFIGQRERFPVSLQQKMQEAEERTKEGVGGTITIALSYGGRAEILDAVNTLLKEGTQEVNEDTLRSAMWSKDVVDPDLIIRTGGEQRLSNFLTWQSVYSELFFVEPHLPDFSEADFSAVLTEYGERDRRRGK